MACPVRGAACKGVVISFLGLVCNLNVTWYLIFKWTQIAGLAQWVHGVCACMLTHGVVGQHAQFTRHIHGCFLPYIGPPHTADGPSASCITSLRAANVINGRYIYMEDLLGLEECIDTTPPVAWPVAPSPVHLSNWEGHLRTHPDKRFATYICSGLVMAFG